MQRFVGIDFGTTNSAIAICDGRGSGRLLDVPGPGDERVPVWRSILFFEPGERAAQLASSAGAHALQRYLACEGEGRLVQSIKSHLASSLFTATNILGRRFALEDLIGNYLRHLRTAAEEGLGADLGRRAVIGRPVRYWGAETEEDDARALARMRAAAARAGFDEVVFEFEPVAAALDYAARLERDELVLIADFGGGTTDFSLIRVGPGVDANDDSAILARGGIGIGGDSFDARIIDAAIAPRLGKGSIYVDEFGAEMVVPPWIYTSLRRWHHLSFLKSPATSALLERIRTGAREPGPIDQLLHVIERDLGLQLHRAVERAKVALSAEPSGLLSCSDPPLALAALLAREAFESWIAAELEAIDTTLTEMLSAAGAEETQVDRVFATGGSSLVPAVRARLAARFGADRVVGGQELTSVAAGLAVRAARRG